MMSRPWTKDEEILALYAYCNVPFNKASNSNPFIVRIAQLISRTPASVKMKIGNFGSFDPQLRSLGIIGLTGVSKLDNQVWKEYYGRWDKLSDDAMSIIAKISQNAVHDFITDLPRGAIVTATVKRRINQDFFRNLVLTSYNSTCCISGISDANLLEACHIIPWSEDESIRTDPTNGLCLNPLFHKAYDNLLMSITADYTIKFSDLLLAKVTDNHFPKYLQLKNNTMIKLPDRFLPNPDYLQQHYQKYRQKNA
jgi:putative restriction endonuclease